MSAHEQVRGSTSFVERSSAPPSRCEQARSDLPTRLYVDRSFSVSGFGTVVTGTLWSGTIGAGDQLRLEPSGHDVRVRSVQVHDRDVERADPGQRVAVSLPGVERGEVARGEALVARDGYPISYRLDIALEELAPIEDGARAAGARRHGAFGSARRSTRRAVRPASSDNARRRSSRRPRDRA